MALAALRSREVTVGLTLRTQTAAMTRTEMKSGGERSASARPARRMATVAQIGGCLGLPEGRSVENHGSAGLRRA